MKGEKIIMASKKPDHVLNAVDWCRKLLDALVLLILGLTTLAIAIIWGYSHVLAAAEKDFPLASHPAAVLGHPSVISHRALLRH